MQNSRLLHQYLPVNFLTGKPIMRWLQNTRPSHLHVSDLVCFEKQGTCVYNNSCYSYSMRCEWLDQVFCNLAQITLKTWNVNKLSTKTWYLKTSQQRQQTVISQLELRQPQSLARKILRQSHLWSHISLLMMLIYLLLLVIFHADTCIYAFFDSICLLINT